MNTITVNTNREKFDYATIAGKSAVFTTHDGERLVGTVEVGSSRAHTRLIIRFDNGAWGAIGHDVELVA